MQKTLVNAAVSAAAAARAALRQRRQAKMLHHLSDEQLKDIGLSRPQIGGAILPTAFRAR